MKKSITTIIIALFVTFNFFSFNLNANEKYLIENIEINDFLVTDFNYNSGYRYNIQGWVYVHIEGNASERGYQYGYLLAEEIVDLIHRWSNMIHNHPKIKSYNGVFSQQKYNNISKIWWDFCKSQVIRMYWDEYPDEYKEEIKGIAAGVSSRGILVHGNPISYEDILTSNQMYELMSKLTDRKIRKGFHPLLDFVNKLKIELFEHSYLSDDNFDVNFINEFYSEPLHHHCSSFIATGNATIDGEIIISNSMWSSRDGAGAFWWSYYIAIRWNIILDVVPDDGYRFMMACAPGYIWSDHDFYQNNAGIVFIETTLPQGIWSEKGLPLAVRARKAVQYSDSIDDVINNLKDKNDGVMNAVWLIGDTKTGEIARFELGLYNDAIINRTFNGFQWSANNPIDFGVRFERIDFKHFFKQFFYYILYGTDGFQYYSPFYHPTLRDIVFKELGEKYYGEIDVDIVKEIMREESIGQFSSDCKITSSELVDNNGMWAFIGNPMGKILDLESLDNSFIEKEFINPVGWVRIFGLPDVKNYNNVYNDQQLNLDDPNILWMYESDNFSNDFFSNGVLVNDIFYLTLSSGYLCALNVNDGSLLWDRYIGENPTSPVYFENYLFFGTDKGLIMIDVGWMIEGRKEIGKIVSNPVVSNNKVFVGTELGDLYAYDIDSGTELWNLKLPGEIYISDPFEDHLLVGSDKYCYKINFNSGDIEWIFETNGMITSRPYCFNDIVYFGSWDTFMYAINFNEGTLKWKFETGWGIENTPIISDDFLYFGSCDNNFYSLDLNNGNLEWFFSCKSSIHSSPIIVDNNVFFGSDDGRFYSLDKNSGNIYWSFSPGDAIDDKINYCTTPILSNPINYNDNVIIGAKGIIYSLII